MSYTLKSTGESGIGKEQYSWKAVYEDGTSLFQYDDDSMEFHQFAEIDQSKLHLFQIFNSSNQADGDIPVTTIIFNPACMKLIHFYKRYTMAMLTPEEQKFTMTVIGYETSNGKVFSVITPQGEVIVTDDINNLQVG